MATSYRIWLIVVILILILAVIIITGVNIYEYYNVSVGNKIDNNVGTVMMWVNIAAVITCFIILALCIWFLVSRLSASKTAASYQQVQMQPQPQVQMQQMRPQQQVQNSLTSNSGYKPAGM